MLELTDAITATPARVTPELRERLQKRFSTAQLVELGAAIAWENYRSRSNRVFGFESEGFYKPAAEEAGDFAGETLDKSQVQPRINANRH